MSLISPADIALDFLHIGANDGMRSGHLHCKHAPSTVFAQAMRGTYGYTSEHGTHETETRGALVAKAGEWMQIMHHGPEHSETMGARWIHISWRVFGALDPIELLPLPPILSAKDMDALFDGIDDLFVAATSLADSIQRQQYAATLLARLFTWFPPTEASLGRWASLDEIQPLLRWLHANYCDAVTPAQMADQTNLSLSHFHARFKSLMRCSPMAYLKRLRINRAQELLCSTPDKLSQIAFAVGFKNEFHLSREFKIETGLSPREYRRYHTG